MSYQDIGDHPDIAAALATGYPRRKKHDYPRCPVCGEECSKVYRDWYNRIVGCNVCADTRNAWEVYECFPERR